MSDLESFKAMLAASREQEVAVAHIHITLHRPTQIELAEIQDRAIGKNSYTALLMQSCVRGWRGVMASDLFPGGDDTPVDYAPELLDALLENETIGPLFTTAFLTFWGRKKQAEEGAAKN